MANHVSADSRTGEEKRFPPFLAIHTEQGEEIPWLASQGDLMANDWEEVA